MSEGTPPSAAPPAPAAEVVIRREGHRFIAENGLIRLDLDLRTEFPYFNFLWLAPRVGAPYERWCNVGLEGMPTSREVLAEAGIDDADSAADDEPRTVWLMGHDYKAKVLRHTPERLDLQVTYAPPMVVVGELSALGGGGDLRDFPDWGPTYWERVETMQNSLQAVWTMEAGRPYIDVQPIVALGEFLCVMPILLHGFCGHPWAPQCAFAGGRFLQARAPDGQFPSYLEDAEAGRHERYQFSLGAHRFLLLFGEEERSTALGIGLHRAEPEGMAFLGYNECAVDPANPNGHFAAAAQMGDWRPNRVYGTGMTDQTLFLPARAGAPVAKVRYYFYPDSPIEYGSASAVRRWVEARPEITDFLRSAG